MDEHTESRKPMERKPNRQLQQYFKKAVRRMEEELPGLDGLRRRE